MSQQNAAHHLKYRRQTRSFVVWMLFGFFFTFVVALAMGRFFRSADLVDLTKSGWMLIPNAANPDPTQLLTSGSCAPGDGSCGTWQRIGKLNFSKIPKAVEARRIFFVADTDLASLHNDSEKSQPVVYDVKATGIDKAFKSPSQGLVITFDEAYGEFSAWVDGRFLGITSRQMPPTRKPFPYAFSEAIPLPENAIAQSGPQRIVVRIDTFRDYDQTTLWRTTSFAIRNAAGHHRSEGLTLVLLAGGMLTLLALCVYHGLVWMRRRDAALLGLTVFLFVLAAQNFFYYNVSAYFDFPTVFTNQMRIFWGYFQPITYVPYALFLGLPISHIWQEVRKRRGKTYVGAAFSDLTPMQKIGSLILEGWCLGILPLLIISPLVIKLDTALAIIYKVGLPVNVLVMFTLTGIQANVFIRESRIRNISYAIPFAAGITVMQAAMIIGLATPLGVRQFPSLLICVGAVATALCSALAVGNQFSQLYREVVSTRRSLRDLVAEGRRVSSFVSLTEIVEKLGAVFARVSQTSTKVRCFFSPMCWGQKDESENIFYETTTGEINSHVRAVRVQDLQGSLVRIVEVKDPRSGDTLALVQVEHDDTLILDRFQSSFEALGNNLASAINTVRLEHAFQALDQRTREMRTVFKYINQGICMLDENLHIGKEYSAATATLLGHENLANQDAINLLFADSRVSADLIATTRTVLSSSYGENELAFELNSDSLPKEIEVQRGGKLCHYEVDWTPITNETSIVDQIMITIRDVTVLRNLRAEAERNLSQIEVLQQIVAVPPESYYRFISTAKDYLASCAESLSQAPIVDTQIREIKRHLHTIKGNSRTMKFHEITNVTHEVESNFIALVEEHRILERAQIEEIKVSLERIHEKIVIYEDVNDKKLRRNRSDDERRTASIRTLTQFVRQSLEQRINNGDNVKEYQVAFHELLRSVYNTFFTLVKSQRDSLSRLSEQLGIPRPRLHIQVPEDWVICGKYADVIHGVFGHLIGNSLDHGFAHQEKRRTGTITLTGQLCDSGASLVYGDDGAGLNLEALRAKGSELGLLTPNSSDLEVAEVIFENGLSTATKVTTISGRGVGLDAARKLLSRNGGSLCVKLLGIKPNSHNRDFEIHINLPKEAILFIIDLDPDLVKPVLEAA